MDKAYDLKALGKALEAAGVPVLKDAAEVTAAKVYVALKAWMKESAALSPNKVDDFAAAFLDQADILVMPAIDKINGKVG